MGGLTPWWQDKTKNTGAKRMKIKEGASLNGLQTVMRIALVEADVIWRELGQELTVTSGTDGEHSAGSLHYYGYALDFRTRYFNKQERWDAYASLVEALEFDGFNIYLHDTHIHVEYDAIKGEMDEWRKLY